MTSPIHQTHPEVLQRLRRAEGQLSSVQAMIEAGRSFLEIAQQLQAAESAVREAKKTFIHDHLDHCLDQAAGIPARKAQGLLSEFRAIAKYL